MEPKWILTFLPLSALLQFVAVEQQPVYITVRKGEDVTLPCADMMEYQQDCSRTTWTFRGLSEITEELVHQGQVQVGLKSDRLAVSGDCGLVIKTVTREDVGQYFCQHFISEDTQTPDTVVDLSVITIAQQNKSFAVTLRCSVSMFGRCRYRVKWLYEGSSTNMHLNGRTSFHFHCFAFVTFETDHFMYKSRFESLQCELTDNWGNVQLFPFRLPPPDEEASTSRDPTTELLSGTCSTDLKGMAEYSMEAARWRFILVCLGLSALIITVVSVNIWTRTTG